MRILAVNGDRGGCAYYRIKTPMWKAQENGFEVTIKDGYDLKDFIGSKISEKKFQKLQPKILKHPEIEKKLPIEVPYDIYVFQRQCNGQGVVRMKFLQEHGKKTIYEIDDALWDIDRTNPAYDAFMSEQSLKAMYNMLTMADGLTVSTEYLKKQLKNFNKNIAVLPNCLDMIKWERYRASREKVQAEKTDNKIRIGYAGSTTHFLDFRILKNVLPEILRRNPNVILKLIGCDWRVIFKEEFKGLENQVEVVPWVDLENYPYSLTDIDIGLAPLADTNFNRCKSNLKWLEYSTMGIPTVASGVEPYKCIRDGVTGILVNSTSHRIWVREIQGLINSRVKRELIGAQARAHVVEKYDINKTWPEWIKFYYGVLNADKVKAAG